MPLFTVAVVLFVVCLILAFIVAPATLMLCILAAFLLVMYLAPSLPWVPFAAATWLLLQLIAGVKSAAAASKKLGNP